MNEDEISETKENIDAFDVEGAIDSGYDCAENIVKWM